MTLYLKYRPKILDELDSEEVRLSVSKLVKSQNIPHAILLTGPKGTGKTSLARVLAKIINCEKNDKKYQEPCSKCTQCRSIETGGNIDIIEIDAASHRGIDDIRSLRDAVKLSPLRARKKIYIIDEAHMLTTEASNALLKTLEEPPDHAVFILATTNPEKLIPTIRSRTTVIQFKRAKDVEIVRSLSRLAKGEKYKIDAGSLGEIARHSEGSFRDATKILEQLISEDVKPDLEHVKKYLETKKISDTTELLSLIADKKLSESLVVIEEMAKAGLVISDVIESMISDLHLNLLSLQGIGEVQDKLISEERELIALIELLSKAGLETPLSVVEQMPLEVAVIKWCGRHKIPGDSEGEIEKKVEIKLHSEKIELEEKSENKTPIPYIPTGPTIPESTWLTILSRVKPINTSVEALLRAARPMEYDGNTLTLGVYYRFHKERLEEYKNRQILEQIIADVLSKPARVICVLTEPVISEIKNVEKVEAVLEESKDEDIVKVAKEIFDS